MLQLAELVREICSSASVVELQPLPVDDPRRRCPDVTVAGRELDWHAHVPLEDGLRRTASWWRTGRRRTDRRLTLQVRIDQRLGAMVTVSNATVSGYPVIALTLLSARPLGPRPALYDFPG